MAAAADTAAVRRITGPAGTVKKDRKGTFSERIDLFNRDHGE